VGVVRLDYDAFDRLVAVVDESPSPPQSGKSEAEAPPRQMTAAYGDRSVTVDKGFRDLTTKGTYLDDSGLPYRIAHSGPGVDANAIERTVGTDSAWLFHCLSSEMPLAARLFTCAERVKSIALEYRNGRIFGH